MKFYFIYWVGKAARPKTTNGGFAALLMVITLSVSLMMAMVSLGDSTWLLRQNVVDLGDRTQRQLAGEGCRQLALLYLAEDPDFSVSSAAPFLFNFENGEIGNVNEVSCSIVSIHREGGSFSPYADRIIETKGEYRGQSRSIVSRVGIINSGLIEKERFFK